MARWRIKEMSDLTKVSVRMLRHYDAIGLLKPSMRSASNYRYYCENDLARLQQIIALRFFNFDLQQIKKIVQQKKGIHEQLLVQMDLLKSQSDHLAIAQKAIKEVLRRLPDTGLPDWSDLISLIEGYRMAEEIKKRWVAEVTNQQQLQKQTGVYQQQYPKEFEAWGKLIERINEMSLGDPDSAEGEHAVKAFMDIAKNTKQSLGEQPQLNADALRSVKEGKFPQSSFSYMSLNPEGTVWIAKASAAYWLRRWESLYQDIDKNIDTDPSGEVGKTIANSWRNLIKEQLMTPSPDLTLGMMLWGEVGRQRVELNDQDPSTYVQDMIKKVPVGLVFNFQALMWIEKALNAH